MSKIRIKALVRSTWRAIASSQPEANQIFHYERSGFCVGYKWALTNPLAKAFHGLATKAGAQWNGTYWDFSDGTKDLYSRKFCKLTFDFETVRVPINFEIYTFATD